MTPKSVAKFLHQYRDKLDKTIIGDYISKEREYDNGFCVKVLHEYVDMMDFTDMEFDGALRVFLSGFRLPGEAQKIDRVMEKFAERYCSQNKAVFPSADMAFILAFSTIMLQTDLHNPAIRYAFPCFCFFRLIRCSTRRLTFLLCCALLLQRGPQNYQGGLHSQQQGHLL